MLLAFDTETTGLWKDKNGLDTQIEHPSQPWPVTAAWFLINDDGLPMGQEFYHVIKPDGWSSEPGALATHKITDEYAEENGLDAEIVAGQFRIALEHANGVVGHNVGFDIKVMTRFMTAFGVAPRGSDPFFGLRRLDTMHAAANVLKIPKSNPKHAKPGDMYQWPRLEPTYRYFMGRDFEGAHNALSDIKATVEIFQCLRKMEAI